MPASTKPAKSKKSSAAPPTPVRSSPSLSPQRPAWWQHVIALVLLLSVNVVLYYRTASLGFLSVDDPDYVINNPYIATLSGTNVQHILTQPYAANYAPANLLSYALDVALAGGRNAEAVHASSIAWHGWTALMVYFLMFTLRAEVVTAVIAALLFILHPAHVEVVAWISSRKDLVGTSFAVLSMAAYLRWRRAGRKGGWWYGLSWAAFVIASAGKQSVLLVPGLMLLWDVLVERRRELWMLAEKIPFGLVTLFFGWMTWHAQPPTNQHSNIFVWAGTEVTNLWLLTGFAKYVLYRAAPAPGAWDWGLKGAIIVGALGAWFLPILFQLKQKPLRTVLGYWILVNMIPPMLLNFIIPITDRYLFLPSVGVCLLLAEILGGLAAHGRKLALLAVTVTAALSAVWAAQTWNYISEWVDPHSVWYGAHQKTANPQVAQFLGEVYQEEGDRMAGFVKAGNGLNVTNELRYAMAVLRDSDRIKLLENEWMTKSTARNASRAYRDELWQLAWEEYQFAAAHRGTISMPNLYLNRGRLLISQGQYQKAVPEFKTALTFAQNSTYWLIREETTVHAMRAIGVAYWNMRKYAEAQTWLEQALEKQKQAGQPWVPTLEQEVAKIRGLAAAQRQAP